MAGESDDRLPKWLARYLDQFNNPFEAFVALAKITVATVLIYILSHIAVAWLQPVMWSSAGASRYCDSINESNVNSCEIFREESDALKVTFNRNALLKSFEADIIDSVRGQLDQYIGDKRPVLIAARRDVFESLAELATDLEQKAFRDSVTARYGRSTDTDGCGSEPSESEAPRCNHTLPANPLNNGAVDASSAQPKAPAILTLLDSQPRGTLSDAISEQVAGQSLQSLAKWLEFVVSSCGEDACGATPERLQYETDALTALTNAETQAWLDAKSIVATLEKDLSLDWLWNANGGWIWELAFWCWFGVLTNTGFALITASRNMEATDANGYEAKQFLYLFPKLLFAPFIAIVVASFIISGITDFTLSLADAWVFLMFAFLSGFAAERFVGIVRAGLARIMPRLQVSDAKLDTRTQWAEPTPAEAMSNANSLSELAPHLRKSVKEKAGAKIKAGLAGL